MLFFLSWLTERACGDCDGLSPGYYADLSSSCRSYTLCISRAKSAGLQFNCPPGTKFQQATQVCHHEAAVKCEGAEAEEKNSHFSEASTKFFSQPENSIDAISKLEDPIRFKREKLTEQRKIPDKRKAKLNAGEENTKIKKIIKKKKNKPWTRYKPLRKTPEKTETVKDSYKKPSNNPAVEEVDPDDRVLVHNCRDSKSLCKSSKLRKEEIGENIRLPASATDAARQQANKDNKKRRLPVVAEKDDASLGRLEKVRPEVPQPGLLIQNLVNDTGIASKLSEDPTIEKPIKSDSDDLQNTSETVEPAGSQSHQQQIGPQLPKLNLRTRPLDKIPFSRVVAAQKKINGQFSPYISFPDLLSNLTKSQRSVRMIPIAISSTEAKYIRNIIKKNKKPKTKKLDHLRLPRKIVKSPLSKERKEKSEKEYQIIYKDLKPLNKPESTTEHGGRTTGNQTNNNATWVITVKPRGPPRGFFNRDKFKQILTSNLRTDKDRNKDTTTEVSLEFGFNPIKSKKKKIKDKRRKVKNEVYFDEFLDTLQAPLQASGKSLSNFSVPAKNSLRSPKHFSPHNKANSVKKQNLDRKSNLDFLGIFDTRKYFFIPPNRRSDTSEVSRPGILDNLVNFFRH